MSEIRLITSSDEHLSSNPPGFRKDNYCNSVLEKLIWQGKFAKIFDADAILRGGDFFHVKEANKTTMKTISDAALIHKNYHCDTFALSGNHDMSKNDPDSIQRQPIGVMYNSGVFNKLNDHIFYSGSMNVRVVGVDYTVDLSHEKLEKMVKKRHGNTYTIAFVHALASMAPDEKIQSFFNEHIFDYRDLVFDGCPDVYVFGHYHKDQGIQEHNGVKFVNLGSVSRGSLTFENIERKPKISSIICNSQGISIEEHEIPCLDPSDIFDFEKKRYIDKERRKIDEFINKLKSDKNDDSTIHSKLEEFRNSDHSTDLKNLLNELLEAAEHGADIE